MADSGDCQPSMISERIDSVTHIPESHLGTVIPPPKSVKIELTGRCNFACTFCARSDLLRKQDDIDRSFFERIVKEMREAGVEELGLFYLGESFMVPWLPEAIKYAKDIGFPYVFLTTNGSLAFPDRVEDCMKAGLDSLKFSYNYADAQQLAQIANVKPKYFQALQNNIKFARKIRDQGNYPCRLYASYIEYDGDQGERMHNAVAEIQDIVDEVYALPLYSHGGYVTEKEKKAGMKPSGGNRGRLDNLVPPIPCWAAFSEGHITWQGKLHACCFGHTDDLVMADLNKVSFLEGWNSPAFQELRKAHLNKDVSQTPCATCFKEVA